MLNGRIGGGVIEWHYFQSIRDGVGALAARATQCVGALVRAANHPIRALYRDPMQKKQGNNKEWDKAEGKERVSQNRHTTITYYASENKSEDTKLIDYRYIDYCPSLIDKSLCPIYRTHTELPVDTLNILGRSSWTSGETIFSAVVASSLAP